MLSSGSSKPAIDLLKGAGVDMTTSEPFNKAIAVPDGTPSASDFTLTNAFFASGSILSSNLTLGLTNTVDRSLVTVVLNGITDLAGNPLAGTNAVMVRALYGNAHQLVVQSIGVLATIVYAVAITFVLLKILDAVMGLRVSEEEVRSGRFG